MDSLRFDGVALVEMEGRGVREMAFESGRVWGIAGPARRGPGAFQFWRIPAGRLVPGARIVPELLPPVLPDASEGIVLSERSAIVVIDGDRGGKKRAVACATAGGQARIALP